MTGDIEIIAAPRGPEQAKRVRIGMITLASGMTGEDEMHLMLPDDVLLLTTRVANANDISMASLAAMEAGMSDAAATILPDERLDAMIYCCTSGTIAMGEATVTARIRAVKPGIPVTTPFTGVVAACAALGVRRVALLAPYTPALTAAMREHLEARGVAVVHTATFDCRLDSEINAIDPRDCYDAALAADRPDAEAVFLCCTGLRVAAIIDDLEAALGKPVVTSNQALAWHALRIAGYADPMARYGRLMAIGAPAE